MDYLLYVIGVVGGIFLGVFIVLHVLSHQMGVDGCATWNDEIMWCAKEKTDG